jgi:hypothetical protein
VSVPSAARLLAALWLCASGVVAGAGQFHATAPMSFANERVATAPLPDGTVFVALGHVARVYDPAEDVWHPLPAPPFALSLPQAVALDDGQVLIVGGNLVGAATAILFDPVARQFVPVGPMITPRQRTVLVKHLQRFTIRLRAHSALLVPLRSLG